MNWAELSYELCRVVLVRDFIGPSGLVRVVFGPSCPAPSRGHSRHVALSSNPSMLIDKSKR